MRQLIPLVGIASSIVLGYLATISPATAQIVPDNTLPVNSTVTPGCTVCTIDGGTIRGANLFHSFSEFSVPTGGETNFNNALQIQNIFSRVTGNSVSNIDGLLRTNGTASLFFLNPNGIIFGPNARLNIGGSFFATTANSFKFPDGSEFSATNPQAPPLLRVNVTPGVQWGTSVPGATITNRGNLASGQDLTLVADKLDLQGQLSAGGDLTLLAQDTVQVREEVTTPFVAVSGGNLTIEGNNGIDILALSPLSPGGFAFQSGGNLSLISDGIISGDARFSSGGSFSVRSVLGGLANFVSYYDPIISTLSDVDVAANYTGTSLLVEATGNIRFQGDINITGPDTSTLPPGPDTATLSTSSALIMRSGQSTLAYGGVNSGNVPNYGIGAVPAGITIGGNVIVEPFNGVGGIVNLSAASGNVSTHLISTNRQQIPILGIDANGGAISISAANGSITTGDLLSYSSSGSGNAGQGGAISLEAANGSITTGNLYSYSSSGSGNAGQGGAISLEAANGSITSGNLYSISSSGSGNAGQGGAISLSARGGDISGQGNSSKVLGSFSISEQGTAGNGGNVALEAKNNVSNLEILTLSSSSQSGTVQVTGLGDLLVTNTKILTSKRVSVPTRAGGFITLNVGGEGQSGDVDVTSLGNLTFNNSSIQSDTKGRDPAGNVTISSPGLVTFNNSQIISNTSNIGNAGDIQINAGQGITFQGLYSDQDTPPRGGLFAGTTNEGFAGNITLTTPELTLQNGANIATTTENLGTAGKITLQSHSNSENLNINLEQGTSISASTNSTFNQATGGTIEIKAPNAVTIQGEGTITTETLRAGQAGNIQVSSRNLDLQQTQLSTSTTATGNAGNITLDTSTLTVARGAKVFALTNGSGDSGTITVNAPTAVNLGLGVNDFSPVLSVETSKAGKAGSIIINTPALTLSDTARITATATKTATNTEGGGSITLNASTMHLAGVVGVFAETSGQTPAGTLTLKPYQNQSTLNITLAPKSQVSASTSGSGNGGDLILSAPQAITIAGQGRLAVESWSTGNAGDILVTTGQFTLTDGVELSAAAKDRGNAGEVRLNTQQLTLDNNAQILASNVSSRSEGIILEGLDTLTVSNNSAISASTKTGEAGSLRINANSKPASSVQVSNNSRLSVEATGEGGKASGVRINTQQLNLNERSQLSASNMDGESQDITLQGLENLQLTNGSEISASTRTGTAGSVSINTGENPVNSVSLSNSRLSVEATREGGKAGGVRINTSQLSLNNNAQILASNVSSRSEGIILEGLNTLTLSNNSVLKASTETGQAGSLSINANSNPANSVQVSNNSRLSVEATAGGTAGNLTIKAGQVSVQDGAAVTVSSPSGIAGNLNITANSLFLNRGTLSAETGKSSPQGGANITLKGLELLRLENESLISARALNAASGGNINIDTKFVIALPPERSNGSDIIASAQQGSGGKIDIDAAGIFGIEERRAIPGNRTNDIDASSEFGKAGQVTLSTLINPSQGLSQLPTQLVDPTRQIDSSCAARGDNESKFTVTGRGGLPSTPSDLLTSDVVLDDFGTLATAKPTASEPVKPASSSPHKQLVEAQGWIIAADGTVPPLVSTLKSNCIEYKR